MVYNVTDSGATSRFLYYVEFRVKCVDTYMPMYVGHQSRDHEGAVRTLVGGWGGRGEGIGEHTSWMQKGACDSFCPRGRVQPPWCLYPESWEMFLCLCSPCPNSTGSLESCFWPLLATDLASLCLSIPFCFLGFSL